MIPPPLLIANANSRGHAITLEQLHDVVANNDKRRFALGDDGMRIRASQGHSVRHVDLDLPAVQPPTDLCHGTIVQFLASIRAQGLLKRSRNHVHLSADRETAMKVGHPPRRTCGPHRCRW
ncbi:MAG: RNA 2'-phosphotransferase [Pirellulaceae bacterium]